jgi:hypothetical protein
MGWTLQRYRYANTNNARCLDINRMVKEKTISPSIWCSGLWVWTDKSTGEQVASVSYESDTHNKQDSFLRIHYTLTKEQKKIDYKIQLSRTQANYGGERFWFICPVTGRRVSKLYLPSGGDIFASRHAYKLLYACQNEGYKDRMLRKKWKLLGKLDPDLNYPYRPKGMHQKTYERLLEKYNQQEDICTGHLLEFMMRHGLDLKGLI